MNTENDLSNEQLAAIAKALAHPARIQIIRLLLSKTSCIGGEITHEVGLAQSTVSEHLRILKAAGVVAGEIEHPRVCYSLNLNSLLPLMSLLQLVADKATTVAGSDGLCCPLTPQSCD
ncbi:ArsR family transcriptional regulator [Rheinheimera pacifica]|uniref:ArsR family transcriptional regulator n=1 Tax=Rheinheimera pacifica TaxID=173990 RepID=A0A1H6J9C3_9GAMM|nr:metalloregulator ArsR/SmtB family transcription factor [Rheinheimera pacifica]SEH58368.1 ArsR family transcriptional regulator [Rheinheimera pacifica]